MAESESIRGEIQELRGDMNTEIKVLRGDMNTEIKELRGDMNTKIESLRGEIIGIRGEMETQQCYDNWED